MFERLRGEGRILSYDWGDYDTMHVVIQPKLMSPVQLYEGFRWAYRETFRWGRTFRRAISGGTRAPIILAGAVTYHKFARRICSIKGFEYPLQPFDDRHAQPPGNEDPATVPSPVLDPAASA